MSQRSYNKRTFAGNDDPTRVVGYVRVSTEDQADSGAGLEVQRRAITDEAHRRGWALVTVYEDAGASGKTVAGRTGLQAALSAVEGGKADALVVAKLDRLSRSLIDFAGLMERSRRKGWALVALDLGVDTGTPQGEVMANVLASFAQFERRLIGQRTKDALAVKRSQGVRLGRPRSVCSEAVRIARELRQGGQTLAAIAQHLNAESIPTAQGGRRWYPSSVSLALRADVG